MTIKVRRVDFSPTEWLEGTHELSLLDRGTYITICALIYARGGRITMELLKRVAIDHGNVINASVARLEQAGKIVRNGSEIGQKRCENELENAQIRSRNGAENVSKRWKNKELTKQVVLPGGNANHQPSTISKIDSDESISPLGPPVGGVIDLEAKRVRRQSDPKGTRLEADWQPSAGDCAFADSYGFRPGEVAEEFRDYWLAKPGPNARKVDWSRTFHAWVRRKAEQPGGVHAGSGSRGNGSGGHGVVAALNRIHIKRRAEGMD